MDCAGNPTPQPPLSTPHPRGVEILRPSPVLHVCIMAATLTLSQGFQSPCPKGDGSSLQICDRTYVLQCPADNHSGQVSSMIQLKPFHFPDLGLWQPLLCVAHGETEAPKSDFPEGAQKSKAGEADWGSSCPRP